MSEDDRLFFVEQLDDTLKRIGEIIAPMQEDIVMIKKQLQRLDTIENDIKAIKAAVRATNNEIGNHDERLIILESKTL